MQLIHHFKIIQNDFIKAHAKATLVCIGLMIVAFSAIQAQGGREIVFCNEAIPVTNQFVATKLMTIIKKQIPSANLPALRQRANLYMPYIESRLLQEGIPVDFKYLPIVESGFNIATSHAGAQGFWQLMPETARGLGLKVSGAIDERNDIEKSTNAALRVLKDYYNYIKRRHNKASWVLTAAAYNFGIGNMSKAISNQGQDYFTMNLNPETAAYVYKIIAVKELWEYPEIYMKNFGYNVFKVTSKEADKKLPPTKEEDFGALNLTAYVTDATAAPKPKPDIFESKYMGGYIAKTLKKFKDGDLVQVVLEEDLLIPGSYTEKGLIEGKGWLIDDKVYIDLGFGKFVEVYDVNFTKGISTKNLKKNKPILLKIITYKELG